MTTEQTINDAQAMVDAKLEFAIQNFVNVPERDPNFYSEEQYEHHVKKLRRDVEKWDFLKQLVDNNKVHFVTLENQ